MPCLLRASVLVTLSCAIALSNFGCGQSRVAQCNEVRKIINQAVNEANQLTNGGQTNDPQAMLQAADAMEQAAQDMEALELTDEKLNEYRVGFITMYQDNAQATREFVKAFENKDRSAAEATLNKVQQINKPEPKLVAGINGYCDSN